MRQNIETAIVMIFRSLRIAFDTASARWSFRRLFMKCTTSIAPSGWWRCFDSDAVQSSVQSLQLPHDFVVSVTIADVLGKRNCFARTSSVSSSSRFYCVKKWSFIFSTYLPGFLSFFSNFLQTCLRMMLEKISLSPVPT